MKSRIVVGLSVALCALSAVSGEAKSRPMKARVVQPLYAKGEAAADACLAWEIAELEKCDESLDLIVLPEACDAQALVPKEDYFRVVDRCHGPLMEACARTAKRCKAVLFVNATDKDAVGYYNVTYAYDTTGALVGKYVKQHLTAGEMRRFGPEASAYTKEWSEPYVLTIDGVRYAFLTCYDFYFYESYANLARMKPDVVIGCSHQRSDKLEVLEFINSFCAYNLAAYLVRSSVSMGLDSPVGGSSMVVAPDGKILGNMKSRVGSLDVTFDPFRKYLKPAGFGNPPDTHAAYVEAGRRPWKYRPAGPAVVPGLKDAPTKRLCANGGVAAAGNTLAALGAATALGAPEVSFSLKAKDGGFVTCDGIPLASILRKLTCQVLMNVRLEDASGWTEEAIRRLDALLVTYDAGRHVYVTTADAALLSRVATAAPTLMRCLEQGGRTGPEAVAQAVASKADIVELRAGAFGRSDVDAVHAAGLRCNASGVNTEEETSRCRAWGVDTLVTDVATPSAFAGPQDSPPRKVIVGTVCARFVGTPEERVATAARLMDDLSAKAARDYPGRRLDLVVLPEHCVMRAAARAKDKVVARSFAERTLGALAKRHGCYVAAGVFLMENVAGRDCPRNCCALFDRTGKIASVYNKVHAALKWGDADSTDSESGLAPGGAFQVVETDFGRLGFLVCYDMSYSDGWAELKRQGADIVAVSSMSPQVFRPSLFAHQHQYWVVTATPRAQAAVITPLGFVKARVADEQTLLTEIDLSYAICHWSAELRGGKALTDRFGEKSVGGIYEAGEDNGIFWSNRPDLTIGEMIRAVNVRTRDAEAGRADRAARTNRVPGRGDYR